MSGLRRKRSSNSSSVMKSMKKPNTAIDFTLHDNEGNRKSNSKRDEDILSSDDEDGREEDSDSMIESSEDEKETADAKKIRMAREYLAKMEEHDDDSSSAPSSGDEDGDDDMMNDDERISKKLEKRRLKQQGLYQRMVASEVQSSVESCWRDYNGSSSSAEVREQAQSWIQNDHLKLCRGHDLTPTCVALHAPTGTVAYSASKDNSILMWDVENQKRLHTIIPRWNPKDCEYTRNSGEVLAMCASDDGRYLAVGGRDATVKIYDVRQRSNTNNAVAMESASKGGNSNTAINIRGIVTTFEGHKGPVTALAFRSQSRQLFSGSDDRCIRHYNLEEMAYIETLYGHQNGITGIACHGIRYEMPYSVARDRTARAWKLAEETHMIYRGGAKISSADCISAIKDDYFLTGHDDGVFSMWLKDKKKAVVTVQQAHGKGTNSLPRGIVSCASLGGSDFAATGSNDGYLRLWKVSTGERASGRKLDSIGKIPLIGYINDIAIGPKARFCVAAVGQEPRLGRWDRVPGAKNRVAIVQLSRENSDESESKNNNLNEGDDESSKGDEIGQLEV
uniref:Anaphase-promoting complex subunit 4 WD40 domain-containing protein n=1 Tax=Chaetoceros debilis TaxID=122233 RepID=A0A7S3V791_9STRA